MSRDKATARPNPDLEDHDRIRLAMWQSIRTRMHHAADVLRRDVLGQDVVVDEAALADPTLDAEALLDSMMASMQAGF